MRWNAPVERTYPELQWFLNLPGSQAPSLMCWRAFRPEDNEDRAIESMSSARNSNIDVQIAMPRVPQQGVRKREVSSQRGSCACQCVRYESRKAQWRETLSDMSCSAPSPEQ